MFHHVFSMFYHVLSMFYLTILHSQFDKTLVSKIDSLWMWVVLRIDDRRDVYLPPPPCAEKVSEIIDDSRFKGTYIFLKCTHFFMFFMFNHSMLAMNRAVLPFLERMQTVKPDFTPHSPFRNCHAFSPSPFPSSFSGMVAGWAGCGLISWPSCGILLHEYAWDFFASDVGRSFNLSINLKIPEELSCNPLRSHLHTSCYDPLLHPLHSSTLLWPHRTCLVHTVHAFRKIKKAKSRSYQFLICIWVH